MSFPQAGLVMFKTVCDNEKVEIFVDEQCSSVPEGVSVAAALLLLDAIPLRHSKVDQSPRAPYCLMGVCAECLVTIDGKPGQFACQTVVQSGMRIDRALLHDGEFK